MMRQYYRRAALLFLLTGLALRALTPLGYMPAAGGVGVWFELCPEQMPVAFARISTTGHAHHQQGADPDQNTQTDADLCQVGHLLFTGMAPDTDSLPTMVRQVDTPPTPLTIPFVGNRVSYSYQPRAPPT